LSSGIAGVKIDFMNRDDQQMWPGIAAGGTGRAASPVDHYHGAFKPDVCVARGEFDYARRRDGEEY